MTHFEPRSTKVFRHLNSFLPKEWETSSAEQLRSLCFGEFGIGLLTNAAFNILATIPRAVSRPGSSFSSAEVQPPGKAMLEGAQRISAPTAMLLKAYPDSWIPSPHMQCSWISSHTAVWHQQPPPAAPQGGNPGSQLTAPGSSAWRSSQGMCCLSWQLLPKAVWSF